MANGYLDSESSGDVSDRGMLEMIEVCSGSLHFQYPVFRDDYYFQP